MPVFSYLAFPDQGCTQKLFSELQGIDHCRTIVADNAKVMVLITDTPDASAEKILQKRLKGLTALKSLAMTFGHEDQ